MNNMTIIEKTKELVKAQIVWTRKGMDEPNYLHSFRVYDMLKSDNYSENICLAWLLHDIIEELMTDK